MKILAVIVAFRPEVEALERNLRSFADYVDKVLLWQNSLVVFTHPKVETVGDGTNRGIAPALNYAWKYAREKGYDYLLTMDQDSCWEDFPAFLKLALGGPAAALFGPRVNDQEVEQAYQPTPLLITSGMLIPLPVLEKTGGWREDYFVDGLDVDFVLHALHLGIPAYKLGEGRLLQQFGRRHKKGLIHVYEYTPERLWGIYRNHILSIRRYPDVAGEVRRMFIRRWGLGRVARILLGEKQRLAKLKAIFRGIRDGFRAHPQPVIGVVTWFGTSNYGTTLQAYATVKALRKIETQPYLLHRFEEPVSLSAIRENFNRRMGIRRFWKYTPDPWPEKKARIRRFCKEELPARWVIGKGDLKRLKKNTDLFLCGSDQLWNVQDHFRGFEFLDFTQDCRKAAFATSIGTAVIPEAFEAPVRERLAHFGPISLRESSGVYAISQITGRADIRQVADPTFLLTAKEWKEMSVAPEEGEAFLLAYLLRPGQEETVRQIALQAGIRRIVSVPAGENPHPEVGEIAGTAGIREFVGLLAAASLVVTDSFHGLALSANLSTPMVLLKRFEDEDPASQNTRLYELAEQLGLRSCFYSGGRPSVIDEKALQNAVQAMRERALVILKETVR